MTVTRIQDVADQVQTFWAPNFQSYLFERLLLMNFCNKEYEGEIKAKGDTVRVSMITPPTGQLLTAGVDNGTFQSEKVVTSKVDLKCDKIALAAYEFDSLSELQSLVNRDNPKVKEALAFAMEQQINNYLYSLVAPSTSAPDHSISGVSTFSKAQLIALRVLAAQAKWPTTQPWFGMLSPSYMGDLFGETTLTSSDWVGADANQLINADASLKRMGFNIYEDNSRTGDYGLFFTPDWLLVARQGQVEVKVSDLHSNHQLGVLMSVSLVFGAIQGNQGNVKHIKVYNT